MKRRAAAALASSLLVAAGCAAPIHPNPSTDARGERAGEAKSSDGIARVALFIAADLRGYLSPCGCSENMRGGIDRAAAQLTDARRAGTTPVFVEGGDSLFGPKPMTAELIPQEERKARALAEAFKAMGLAVRFPGELDDARGAAFRQALKLPELKSGEWRVLDVDGHPLGVAAGQTASDLLAAAKAARGAGSTFVLGLFHGPLQAALALASSPQLQADLVVVTHSEGPLGAEENHLSRSAGKPVAQLQSRGRSLLRVDLAFGAGASSFEPLRSDQEVERDAAALDERIHRLNVEVNEPGISPELKPLKQQKLVELVERRSKLLSAPAADVHGKNAFTARFVPLDAALPSDPGVRAVVETYDRDVGRLNLEWAKAHGKDCPPPTRDDPAFVGDAQCLECHDASAAVYNKSKHAHAFASLEQQGKQFHLNCIGCHVTGYARPGGVCRLDKTAGRRTVGCESCHGAGALHSDGPTASNIVKNPPKEVCVTCHDPENSPTFDYARYLPQILGPGHGAPVAEAR